MPDPERSPPPDVKYVPDPDVLFAVEVALAAGRPLLLRGKPGGGKTSLAAYVAKLKDWDYYRHTVTSRTRASDLCWSYDAIARLAAAQVPPADAVEAREALDVANFVTPGPIWKAYAGAHPAVVLVDEIDKADPDVPNDLLEVFGEDQFIVDETGDEVTRPKDRAVLLILTTNEERELPRAFLRRCVVVHIPLPDEAQLVDIAVVQLGDDVRERATALAAMFVPRRARPDGRLVSTAEFVDALRAGMRLPADKWALIEQVALWKEEPPP